ncbi:MAG: btuB [Gemmatimonadetes bacterium]|nr:btuB [Gemmatimonadota bacterium]
MSRARSLLSVMLVMTVAGRARAQVPGELRGHVTDVRTSRPVTEARIDVVGQTEHAESGMDGGFVLHGLEPRSYGIRVRAFGYAPYDADVEIVNGRATTMNVVLQPVASLLDAVVVREGREGRDNAGAVVFDRLAVERSGRRDLGELLQTTPGVVITQAGGPGSATHISIRGSSANEVLVLVDGAPINSVIGGEADLSRIPLETVERVTVLTGAQSSRYGNRALAGVVLIETRRPSRDISATTRAGAWGERDASATIGGTRPMGNGARRAGASLTTDYRTILGDFAYDVPAVRGGGTAHRVNADATTRSVLGGLSLDGEDGTVRLRTEWQTMDRGLAGSIVQPSLTGRQEGSRLSGGLDARRRHGTIAWTGNLDVTREHAAFADPDPPFGGTYDDVVDATGVTASTAANAALSHGSAMVGAEARTLDVSSTMLTAGAPHEQRSLGTWAAARAARQWANDVEIAGDLSARLDWNSLLRGATASPRAGVTLSHDIVALSLSVGQGYAAPSLADQFFHEGVLVRPNPNLQPERVRGEIEGRAVVHDTRVGPLDLSADATVYRANVDGMILWLPDFRFVWSPSNFDVHRMGWTMSGRAALPAAGVDLQGTLNRSNVTYAGSVLAGQVAYRPRTTASVVAGLTRAGARLDVTTRVVGERRTVPGAAINSLESYWLSDVKAAVPLVRRAWSLDGTFGVENVFDHAASMLVDYPFPGRTWTVAFRMRRGAN